MRKTLFTLAIASASVVAVTACSSAGWGQRGSQQSGGQPSGSTHTLTGGAEAAPTSEATPRPAGSSSNPQEYGPPSVGTPGGTQGGASSGTSGVSSGGTSNGTSGTGTNEGSGGGSMDDQPAQPVPPGENMGSSAAPTGTQSGGKNSQQPGQ
jgi:hypothetical protein